MAQPVPFIIDENDPNPYYLLASKEINGWYVEVREPSTTKEFILASLFTAEWGHKNFMLPRIEGVTEEDLVENVWKNVVRFQLSQAEDQVVEFLHRGGKLS